MPDFLLMDEEAETEGSLLTPPLPFKKAHLTFYISPLPLQTGHLQSGLSVLP